MWGRKASVTKRTRNGVAPEPTQRLTIANNLSSETLQNCTALQHSNREKREWGLLYSEKPENGDNVKFLLKLKPKKSE